MNKIAILMLLVLPYSLFCAEVYADVSQKNDVKEKVLYKGKEYYDKRLQKKVAKKDPNATVSEDDIKQAKELKKRIEDCARRKDGTIDFIKYKECKEKLQ
ncbi:MAG: hypothetical protein PHE67_10070 [Campylobacterales bacterium]|nr:hypothetical protein [Campylobacterales bacterium]